MNIEYGGLPKTTILRITYPDYAEHLRRTKAHNDGQSKSERNRQHAMDHKIKQKEDIVSANQREVDSSLRLSLIDGTVETDLSLKPITFKELRRLRLFPEAGVIFESQSVQINSVPDPLGL